MGKNYEHLGTKHTKCGFFDALTSKVEVFRHNLMLFYARRTISDIPVKVK